MLDLDSRPARPAAHNIGKQGREAPSGPARSHHAPQGGVIKDARSRQRRRRYALIVLVSAIAGALVAYGSGGAGKPARPAHARSGFRSAGSGISVRVPHGWRLYRPPITLTTYPYDRLLLTSYPATRGGQCGPTKAERALPPDGALIYLIEYAAAPTGIPDEPPGMGFTPQSRGIVIPRGHPRNYECSAAPSYIVRFNTAGRLMQATLAFGSHATASRRAEATRILTEMRAERVAPRP